MKNQEHFFIKIILLNGRNQEAKKKSYLSKHLSCQHLQTEQKKQFFRKKKRLSEQLCKNIDQTTLSSLL